MKHLMAVLPVALFSAVLLAGCDDDGNNFTLDAYFEEVEDLVADNKSDQNEALTTLNESSDLAEMKDAFESIPDSLSSFLDGMNALAPPSEAADAHDDAVEAGEAFLEALEDVNEDVQATETVDAFVETASNDALQDLSADFNATCPPLQAIATESEIDVDLSCPVQ